MTRTARDIYYKSSAVVVATTSQGRPKKKCLNNIGGNCITVCDALLQHATESSRWRNTVRRAAKASLSLLTLSSSQRQQVKRVKLSAVGGSPIYTNDGRTYGHRSVALAGQTHQL